MSDTADYDFDPHFEQDPVNWALDPLEDESGGILAVHRVALVRIACVAAETGARMQRDGLAEDPVGWMVSPLELFEGRAPIEACMERSACSKASIDPPPARVGGIPRRRTVPSLPTTGTGSPKPEPTPMV